MNNLDRNNLKDLKEGWKFETVFGIALGNQHEQKGNNMKISKRKIDRKAIHTSLPLDIVNIRY